MPENLSSGARVARGATYLFVQGFIASLIGVVYILVVTRTFEKETELLGIYATLNLILTTAQVFGTFTLSSASTKYIAQYMAEGKPEKAKAIVSRVLQISTIACAVAFILISFLASFLSSSLLGSPLHASLFYLLAVASVLNILYVQIAGFVQGSQRILELAIISAIYTVLQNVIGISLLSFGFGLWGIVIGWIAGLFPAVLFGLVYTGKLIGVTRDFHPIRPLIKFSFPLFLSNILSFFVGWIDQILVLFILSAVYGLVEGQRVLGLYYIAVRASVVPSLVSSSIITALFPKLSELHAKGGTKSLGDAFRASTRYASLVGFPMIIGLASLAYPVMILFAPALVEAAWPLSILCLAMLPLTLGAAINPTLLTQERIKVASLIVVVSVISEAAISYVLLIPLGMVGAALSRVVASLLSFVLGVFALRKSLGIAFDKEALWKSSVSSILMVLGMVSLDIIRQYIESGIMHFDKILIFSLRFLPIYLVVGAMTYFVSLIALRAIKKHDLDLLRDYLPRGFKWVAAWLSRVARVK
jgi:O-antigen/teichoic acid export membrane protein